MKKLNSVKFSKDSMQPGSKTSKIFCGVCINMAKHIVFLFRTYLDLFIDLIFSFFFESKKRAIPDLEPRHSILTESAVTLATKIRNKELKSEELVKACIERIQTVNPIINAVTDERFEDALKEAREVDRMIEEGLSADYFKKKPFLGVPFTAKESHAVQGLLHTLGLRARAHIRAHEDAECVRAVREAGAIPLAVTNVPEINKWFGYRGFDADAGFLLRLFGLNPTAGYTSLKAADIYFQHNCKEARENLAMFAKQENLFALGSALRDGEADTMASIGFVSRHCSDLAPLTKLVVGKRASELNLDRPIDLKNIKYYYTETAEDLRVSPINQDLRRAMKNVINKLNDEAASTDRTPKQYYHPGFDHMLVLWRYWMTHEVGSFAHQLTNNQGEAKFFKEFPKKLIGQSEYTLAAIMKLCDDQVLPPVNGEWAENITKQLKDDLLNVLGEDGVLLFPSAPAVAPYNYSLFLRPFNFAYWAIFNVLRLPAIQVPLGLNDEGIPLGIQVVAAPRNEALCLAVAEHLGKAFGGYVPPCGVNK